MKLLFTILLVCITTTTAQINSQMITLGLNFLTTLLGGNEKKEEATHTTVWKADKYDEREYPSMNWVCTEKRVVRSNVWDHYGVKRLRRYFEGDNEEGIKMNITIPVSIEFKKNVNGTKALNTCMFIGEKYQANPPKPKNRKNVIVKRDTYEVFTKSFGGYPKNINQWLAEVDKLKTILKEEGEDVEDTHMFWNVYDRMWKFWGRRNEVWLLRSNGI